jgi:hypothetical protein
LDVSVFFMKEEESTALTDTPKKYGCPYCAAVFLRAGHVDRHIILHAEQNYMCVYCEVGFTTEFSLECHKASTHSHE